MNGTIYNYYTDIATTKKTAVDLIEIRKNQQSENLQKLSQEWNKVEWIWREDFPYIKTK